MDPVTNKGKASKAAEGNTTDTMLADSSGLSEGQVNQLMNSAMVAAKDVSTLIGHQAAAEFLAGARPGLEKNAEEIAKLAVAQALSRHQKASALKTYGTTVAVSAGVFVAGTLAMMGVDRYKHRNDQRSRDLNPQYQHQLAQT